MRRPEKNLGEREGERIEKARTERCAQNRRDKKKDVCFERSPAQSKRGPEGSAGGKNPVEKTKDDNGKDKKKSFQDGTEGRVAPVTACVRGSMELDTLNKEGSSKEEVFGQVASADLHRAPWKKWNRARGRGGVTFLDGDRGKESTDPPPELKGIDL